MRKWGRKREHGYILTDFNATKKKYGEDIKDFIKIFNKLYKKLPAEITPP